MLAAATLAFFSTAGDLLLWAILGLSSLLGAVGCLNLISSQPRWQRQTGILLFAVNLLFMGGFILICWFHWQIHDNISLTLPDEAVTWLNSQLNAMNKGASFSLPLYDPAQPPRYTIPVWIENEKYFFFGGVVVFVDSVKLKTQKAKPQVKS